MVVLTVFILQLKNIKLYCGSISNLRFNGREKNKEQDNTKGTLSRTYYLMNQNVDVIMGHEINLKFSLQLDFRVSTIYSPFSPIFVPPELFSSRKCC